MFTFVEVTQEEFDNFSQNFERPAFVQSVAMVQIQKDQNKQVAIYGVKENNELIGAGLFVIRPVISKYTIAHCNQGPLIDYNNQELLKFYFNHVKQALKKYNCLHCLVTPNFEVQERNQDGKVVEKGFSNLSWINNLKSAGLVHQGFDNSLINGVGRWMFKKDMSQLTDEKKMMSSLNQSARTLINRVNRMPYHVEDLDLNNLEDFNQIMEHTSKRREFDNRGLDYFKSLKANFKDNLKVLVAYLNFNEYLNDLKKQETDLLNKKEELLSKPETKKSKGQLNETESVLMSIQKRLKEVELLKFKDELVPLAGAMFVQHGSELTYFLSGAYDEYFGFDAPYILQKQALTWALDPSIITYNFYGTNGKFSGHEDEGVYIFKKGFGGVVIEQPGNFVLEVNPVMNKLYNLTRLIRK